MTTATDSTFDIDRFYSAESISDWKQVIGEDLHYHFGFFLGSEDLETGLKQTIRNFYPHIAPGSRVLDIGCGWGGPARLLTAERDCKVTGITVSSAQIEYCRSLGLTVRQENLDKDSNKLPGEGESPGTYDLIFSLEMISHIRDKTRLLRRLRASASRLIISESCAADTYTGPRDTFGGSMVLSTVAELTEAVEAAGWRIKSVEDRRFPSLRTLALWKQNLDRVYRDRKPTGQLACLQSLVDIALESPLKWGQTFPLIDIVAD